LRRSVSSLLLLIAILAGWAGISGADAAAIPRSLVLVVLGTVTTAYPCVNSRTVRFSANRAVFVALLLCMSGFAGAAAALSGLLAGIAATGFRSGSLTPDGSGNEIWHLLSGILAIIILTSLSILFGSIITSYISVAVAFASLVIADTLFSAVLRRAKLSGLPELLSRHFLVYVLLTPVAVVLIRTALASTPQMLAAVSIPVAAYSILLNNREKLVERQHLKITELSTQNSLVSNLMNTESTTELIELIDGYLRRQNASCGNMILSRLPGEAGWMVWSSRDQVATGAGELPVALPGINELTAPCLFRERTGVFLGLSEKSDLLLFSEMEAAERLASLPPDVRNNLALLLNQSWQVMGHQMKSEEAFLAAAVMLARLVDSKDDYTHGHSLRVADLAGAIGVHLGLGDEDMKTLRVGALLHDLGKIAIDTEILTKRGLLTTEERSSMERHSREGAAIVRRLKGYDRVADIILSHHEKLDGSGYPEGLQGRMIPFLTRIVTVADTFDAITSTRSYHALIDQNTALDTIYEGRGSQFDARIVDALRKVISANALGRREEHGV
jgi:putative nucleotidyltransferase with HDIG domain